MARFNNELFRKYVEVFGRNEEEKIFTIEQKRLFIEQMKVLNWGGLEEGRRIYGLLNEKYYKHILSQPHYQYPLRWKLDGGKRDVMWLEYLEPHYRGCDFLYSTWAPHPSYVNRFDGATEYVWRRLRPYIKVSKKDGAKFVPVINNWRAFHWGWGLTKVMADWYKLAGEVPNCEILGF